LPAIEEATSSWGEIYRACSQLVSRQNVVRGDDLKVDTTECIHLEVKQKRFLDETKKVADFQEFMLAFDIV